MEDRDSEIDSKYAILFQPIKDLAKNFDIDLNQFLDEYLSQLDATPSNGSNFINFAEAAFVLRGSTSVFSKKVDYLYDLVVAILQAFNPDKLKKKSADTEPDDTSNISMVEDMPSTRDLELSKNLYCREDTFETTLGVSMPLSLRRQKTLNQPNSDCSQVSSFDRKSFTMNSCKLFHSTIVLNYSEMSPLLHFLKDNDEDEIPHPVAMVPPEVENEGLFAEDEPEMEDVAECVGSPMKEIEVESIDIMKKVEVNVDVVPKKVKNIELLDPLENDTKKFIKPLKAGRSFKIPRSVLKKENFVEKSLPSIQSFYETHRGRNFQSNNRVSVEREFEDHLPYRSSVKKKIPTKEFPEEILDTEDGRAVDDDDGGDDNDAMFPCDDPDLLNFSMNIQPMEFQPQDDLLIASSYEEIVKYHMTQFFESIDSYKVKSELAQRVADWEAKVEPMLQDEEGKKQFDIHDYGSIVLQRLKQHGAATKSIKFSEVVANEDRVETCRLFMATLHLVNDYNVDIGDDQHGLNSFSVKLLSKDSHTYQVRNQLMPSQE